MIGVAEYLSASIAEPCDFSAAFCSTALDEHAVVAHAQRVAGHELRRAAVMAERVGEQQLADMLGVFFHSRNASISVTPLPRRNSSSAISSAANLTIVSSLTPSALICWAISSYFGPMNCPRFSRGCRLGRSACS